RPCQPPLRDVCSSDMFVHAPVTTIVSRPSPASRLSSFVPCHADIRIFSTTKSPSCASSPSAGSAPHVPRTSAPAATPPKSGAVSLSPGAPALGARRGHPPPRAPLPDGVPGGDPGCRLPAKNRGEVLHVLDDVLVL